MACAASCATLKLGSRSSSETRVRCEMSTEMSRSTMAPFEIIPTVGWFTVVVFP